jgi:Orn/Lys/Arg decarboxylase-like protein
VIASESGDADPQSDQAMERLREAIEQRGYNVIRTFTLEDGVALIEFKPVYSAILISCDFQRQTGIDVNMTLRIISAAKQRSLTPAAFLVVARTLISEGSTEVLEQVTGHIRLFLDEPTSAANRVHLAVVGCKSD